MSGTWTDTLGDSGTWSGTGTATALPSVVTDPASSLAPTTATLNGTNGPVAADNTSFWWGTSPISGTLTPGVNPGGSSEFPSTGWASTGVNPGASVGQQFSYALTGLTPNTTYYFVAWSEVGGIWYPGVVLSFETATAPPTVLPSVATEGATNMTSANATLNGTNGPVAADNTSFWWGTSPISGTLTPGVNPGGSSEFPSTGWASTGVNPGASVGQQFSYALTGLTPNTTYYFVAWSEVGGIWYPGVVLSFETPSLTTATCPAGTTPVLVEADSVNSASYTPTFSTAELTSGQKYLLVSSGVWQNANLNVADTAYASTDNWTTYMEGYNISSDNSTYYLGPNEFQLQVDGNFVNWGSYNPEHQYSYLYTGTGSPVGLMVFDGDSTANPPTSNTGWYGDNSGSLSVNVYSCDPPTGTLVVYKDAIGGDGKFSLYGSGSIGTFSITTTGGTGSQEFDNLAPGTYTVTEPSVLSGWQQTDNDCDAVVVTAGGTATCTVTNVKNGTKNLGEIRGTKYIDRNGDGKLKGSDHSRLAGVTIYLDLNNNGQLDPGEPSTVTNRFGDYRFPSLPAGTYVVREVVQPGWEQTYPKSGSYTIILSSGKISKKDDFGNFKPWKNSGWTHCDSTIGDFFNQNNHNLPWGNFFK
jgi:hypothetical protein